MNSQRQRHFVLTFTLCLWSQQLRAAPGDDGDELLVKWLDGPASHAASAGNALIGGAVKRSFNAIGWQQVKLPPGMSIRDGMQAYQALGTVLAVEPNDAMAGLPQAGRAVSNAPDDGESAVGTSRPTVRLHGLTQSPSAAVSPNDPRYRLQWNLRKISATNAWSATTGSTNVVVAVLDTGVNYNHEDLADNMWRNPGEIPGNGLDDDGNGFVDDVYGIDTASDALGNDSDPFDEGLFYHGTVCAGLIGAAGNNGKGISGVNWAVRIMAIRVGTTNDLDNIADVIAGYDYVVSMKRRGVNIRVTNNSYGSDPRSVYSQALKDAIDAAGNEGILNVFAANAPSLTIDLDPVPRYPVRFDSPSMVVVGASDRSDNLAWVSSYGRTGIDLAAPGLDIASTYGPEANDYIDNAAGTSFSCPIVAGAAALLLSVHPLLTVDELKAAIFGSVDPAPGLKGKFVTNGRLNVARALQYLTLPDPPAIVVIALPGGPRTPTNAPIQVAFNRPMSRASIEGSFVVEPPVAGRFEWSADSRSLAFIHDSPFDSTTNYTVRIKAAAQDNSGGTLDGNFNQAREGSPADDFVWTFSFPLANDDFANAQMLSGAAGSISGGNRFASTEFDEPSPLVGAYEQFGMSVWYRWTAPDPGGWITMDLGNGTTFDSLLGIYTGDRLDQKVPIAGNDSYGTRRASRVSFQAFPRTTYSVVVASKSVFEPSQAGSFGLAWYPTPPPGFSGTQFSPSSGLTGARVTLTGTNFTEATAVLFNGASATFANAPTNNADLRITATVPADASSGPITVVTPHGNVTSTAVFFLLPPALTIRIIDANFYEVTWPGTSPEFDLQQSDQLRSEVWNPIPAHAVERSDGQSRFAVTFAGANTHVFYRLKGK